MKYRKYHVDTDYDLNSRGKKKGANRIVVNRGWTAIENGTPYITIQLQWYPLPWAGVCKGGKYENVRLTLEETVELIDILKEQKDRHEKEMNERKEGKE